MEEVLLGEEGKIEQIDEAVPVQIAGGVTFVDEPIVCPIAKVSKIDDAVASRGSDVE